MSTFQLSPVLEALGRILPEDRVVLREESLEKLSKDFYWYSPVLKRQLEEKRADFALKIETREELLAVSRVL
ncbi:MAG: FAD-binding oxidoreductase, partial [Verrucomicrobiota bacterium]